jgi:hypothetical protein
MPPATNNDDVVRSHVNNITGIPFVFVATVSYDLTTLSIYNVEMNTLPKGLVPGIVATGAGSGLFTLTTASGVMKKDKSSFQLLPKTADVSGLGWMFTSFDNSADDVLTFQQHTAGGVVSDFAFTLATLKLEVYS